MMYQILYAVPATEPAEPVPAPETPVTPTPVAPVEGPVPSTPAGTEPSTPVGEEPATPVGTPTNSTAPVDPPVGTDTTIAPPVAPSTPAGSESPEEPATPAGTEPSTPVGEEPATPVEAPTNTTSPVEPPTETAPVAEYTLVHPGASCGNRDRVGYLASHNDCGIVCRSFENCHYFMFDESDGECLITDMNDGVCEDKDGLASSNFYDIWRA